jgi:hypothetical protein
MASKTLKARAGVLSDGKNPLRHVKPVPQFKLNIRVSCPIKGVTAGILGEAVLNALEQAGIAVLRCRCTPVEETK